jgi:hypothetical protein
MESKQYAPLGNGWETDPAIKCCIKDPNDTPPGCDCCYNGWTDELTKVKKEYNKVSEQSTQLTSHYKFTADERDKLKVWVDDLNKTDQLAKALCDQFKVMVSQTEKICINSEKSVDSIEILFCMIRDLYEQVDMIVTVWNQIDNCIKCLNSEELPPDSGIRKCLQLYLDKVNDLLKTRSDLLKAVMAAIRLAYGLHEGICSDYGLHQVVLEWKSILNCDAKCGSSTEAADPCKEPEKNLDEKLNKCRLSPILTLPVCNDAYYIWVKKQYDADVAEANALADQLVEVNKKKESLAACKASLESAIKEVNPKDLCK